MQLSKTIKTVICDDHHIFRVGLKEILKNYDYIDIIAEANNGVELTNLVLKLNTRYCNNRLLYAR